MDQMHWPVTSLHPSTETYQEDISYKFHIVYFINTDNLNNHTPKSSRYWSYKWTSLIDNSKSNNHLNTYL